MDSSRDLHYSMSSEAGPSRCHMESSFYNILHSSGFAEWAARAELQNSRWRATHGDSSPSTPISDKPSRDFSPPAQTFHTRRNESQPRTSPTSSKEASPESTQRLVEESASEAEQTDDGCSPENFTWHCSNYSSNDAELMILKKHLMQRRGS